MLSVALRPRQFRHRAVLAFALAAAFSGHAMAAQDARPGYMQPPQTLPAPQFEITSTVTAGAVVTGKAPEGAIKLVYDGQSVPMAADGQFVIGLSRDIGPEVTLTAILTDGTSVAHTLAVTPRQFDIQHISGLPPKTVALPPELQQRRLNELRQIVAARAVPSADLYWTQPFIWPASGRMSGVYGSQRFRNGVPGSPHWGVDIANKTGTPVVAPAAGTIRLAEADFLLEGGLIIIDHGFNLYSSMLHLSRIDVKAGDFVAQGQLIGAIGSTGRSTGPHLHWGVKWANVHVDPMTLPGLPPIPEVSVVTRVEPIWRPTLPETSATRK